jgi:hypothetical protein
MTEKRYAMKVAIILGVSVVLMLFFFVLVAHHRDISDRVQQHRGALSGTGSGVADHIKPLGQVSVPSAETRREPEKNVK